MYVTIISIPGCDSAAPAAELVQRAAAELGLAVSIEHRVVTTEAEAIEHKVPGSPTIRVNGLDIMPEARDTMHFGLG